MAKEINVNSLVDEFKRKAQTQVNNKVKNKRNILKLRRSEIKKLPKDFIANVNKAANLSWQVLNEQQLLHSVGKTYRNFVYDALHNTREELFKEYGIRYNHSLVGDDQHQDFDYAKLQLLGINRKRRKNDPIPKDKKKRSKDSYMFTIKGVHLDTDGDEFKIKTDLHIDQYLRINFIKKEHITYKPGHQYEAGVTLWNKIFVPNVFPIKTKHNSYVYMFRIKTSPKSPNLWTNVDRLKAEDIYRANTKYANNFYESGLKNQGNFESKLSCYAFANVGAVLYSVVNKHLINWYNDHFLELWHENINYKIKKVMEGRALHKKYPGKRKKQ